MSRWKELVTWLRNTLSSLGAEEEEDDEWQARDSVAIAVCILLAILFWFTLKMQEEYPVALNLPTRIIQVPEGESLARQPTSSVQVQVRGEGWQLLQLYYRRHPVLLDASREEIDVLQAVRLSAGLPAAVSVVSANPQTIRLPTGPKATRHVPIDLQAKIEPARLYDLLAPPTVTPDSVEITGARSLVEQIDSWPTEHAVRTDVSESMEFLVPLSDTLNQLVEKEIQRTTVSVEVALFTEGIRTVPVEVTDVPPGTREVRLEPPEVKVIYRVPLNQFEEARTARGFTARVPFSAIREDTTGTVSPHVQTPEELIVRDLRVDPDELQYFTVIPSE
jgi:hypothetical protein